MSNVQHIHAVREDETDIRPYAPPSWDAHPTYVHVVPGRARVRIPLLRRSGSARHHVREALLAQDGVLSVEVDPGTGGVLIRYDQDRASAQGLLTAACSAAMASGPVMPNRRTGGWDRAGGRDHSRFLQLVLSTCAKMAVEAMLASALGVPVRRR